LLISRTPPVVAIYRPVDGSEASHEQMRACGCTVLVEPFDKPDHPPRGTTLQADVLMGATFRGGIMDAAWFDQFPRLRLVSKYTIGFDDVDLSAATARGIAVTHCPTEANWGGVAEGAMAMILTLIKRVRERDVAVKTGRWRDASLEGRYLGSRDDGYAGLTVGIVGLGRAGGRLADLLRPWRVRVLACDPYIDAQKFAAHGAQSAEIDELLSESDIVSLHCSLTPETLGMIDARRLALMKPGSILVNTARGKIVDLDALLAGLDARRPAQAALDVFPDEPVPDPQRLSAYADRLLLSPHMIASNEGGTLLAAVPWATAATYDALRGIWPERVVNPEVRAAWLGRFGSNSLLQQHTVGRSGSRDHVES
jgi:phosphoglycerate dehydrogenase-like enzyme